MMYTVDICGATLEPGIYQILGSTVKLTVVLAKTDVPHRYWITDYIRVPAVPKFSGDAYKKYLVSRNYSRPPKIIGNPAASRPTTRPPIKPSNYG